MNKTLTRTKKSYRFTLGIDPYLFSEKSRSAVSGPSQEANKFSQVILGSVIPYIPYGITGIWIKEAAL